MEYSFIVMAMFAPMPEVVPVPDALAGMKENNPVTSIEI